MIEAYDILSLNCELLSERIKLLQLTKECPPDLVGCVSTLMYAAPRVDGVPELATIRDQFISKYGKRFDDDAMSNSGNVLNERVVTKLSVQPPAAYLVQTYLEQISDKFDVGWSSSDNFKLSADQMGEPIAPPCTGYSVPFGNGTGLGGGTTPKFRAHSGMTVTGDDDDNMNSDNKNDDDDDDDVDPLPPHFPYSRSLRDNNNGSSSGTSGGGGGSGTIPTSVTTSNTCKSMNNCDTTSKRGGNDCNNNNLPHSMATSLSYSGTSAVAKSTIDEASLMPPPAPAAKSNKIDETSLMPPPAPLVPPSSVLVLPVAPSSGHNNHNNNIKRDDDDTISKNDNNDKHSPSPSSSCSGRDSASYDEMAARFEALKNM